MDESHEVTAVAPDGSAAFSIEHRTVVPARSVDLPAFVEVRLVWWEAVRGWVPRIEERVVPRSAVSSGGGDAASEGHGSRLARNAATGSVGGARWEVSWDDDVAPVEHLGRGLAARWTLPPWRPTLPSPCARFAGVVQVDGRHHDVGGWFGHRRAERTTGRVAASVRATCSVWDDDRRRTVDGASVAYAVGPARLPWLTTLRGTRDGATYGSTTLLAAIGAAAVVDWPEWTAYAGRHHDRIRVEATLDPSHAAGVAQLQPDGRVRYRYTAADARVSWRRGAERATSSAGALAFVVTGRAPRIARSGFGSVEEVRRALQRRDRAP